MIVVKIGGSLYSSPLLKKWVNVLASLNNQKIIIVPGGGPFADQVRQASKDWTIGDEAAHNMAIMAMQQYALLIGSLNDRIQTLDSIDSLATQTKHNVYVWLPHRDASCCPFPKNWQVTSDSLSLWLASKISAKKLLLVKSANVDYSENANSLSSELVDEYFSTARVDFKGDIGFYHASQSRQCVNDINNND